jgi:hypothetical protein
LSIPPLFLEVKPILYSFSHSVLVEASQSPLLEGKGISSSLRHEVEAGTPMFISSNISKSHKSIIVLFNFSQFIIGKAGNSDLLALPSLTFYEPPFLPCDVPFAFVLGDNVPMVHHCSNLLRGNRVSMFGIKVEGNQSHTPTASTSTTLNVGQRSFSDATRII